MNAVQHVITSASQAKRIYDPRMPIGLKGLYLDQTCYLPAELLAEETRHYTADSYRLTFSTTHRQLKKTADLTPDEPLVHPVIWLSFTVGRYRLPLQCPAYLTLLLVCQQQAIKGASTD